jgi:hypothetical protein
MGKQKVPPGDAPEELRIEPAKVWYALWYVERFPVSALGGKLDKDPDERPWIMGLLADLRAEGRFKNPVIVWNHHPLRGRKQPYWLLRAGSNRVWCAEQLEWTHVPAIVSTAPGEPEPRGAVRIWPKDLQEHFPDGGNIWANEHGFGLLRAKKPEETYAAYCPSASELASVKPTEHHLDKIINPLLD